LKVKESQIASLTGKLKPSRRSKLVAMALVFISLPLAGFAAVLVSPKILPTLSALNLNFPQYVRLTNALIAVICAGFFLWPREGSRLVGRWNDYVGMAFFTFFVQYGIRFFAIILELQFPTHTRPINFVSFALGYLGSYVNNILFLAAARVLLNKNRQIPKLPSEHFKRRRLQALKKEWAELRSALPNWYLIVLPVSLIPPLEHLSPHFPSLTPYLLWVRFPDAIFSVYCLSWFGYAVWLSFFVRRRRMLACLGFMLVLSYGAGQLVHAANPFVGYSIAEETNPKHLPATWIRQRLQPRVSGDISKLAEQQKESSFEAANRFFDGAIFAILFPMKSLLFLPAFILYLLSIISVNDFRRALRETMSKRQDYLSADGILSAIGTSTNADEVELIIRLPGVKWRGIEEERVLSKMWILGERVAVTKKPQPYPLRDDDRLVRAMQTDGEEIIETSENYNSGAGPQTTAAVSIRFHGGVIGVLQATFRGYGKFNNGTLEQLKFMAELIGPSVQDFRTVLVVDKLSQRLIRALASKSALRKTNQTKSIVDGMVETLYDLLNPLGICLLLECGFRSAKLVFPREGPHHDLLANLKITYQEILAKLEGRGQLTLPIIKTDGGPVRFEPDQLSAGTEMGRYYLGTMILAIPDDRDHFARPTLAAYYLTRRMLASLTAQGIFAAARNSLSVVIQELSVGLNQEKLSIDDWFAKIEQAGKASGCLWVVASIKEGNSFFGRRADIEVVRGLTGEDRRNLMSKPLGCIPYHKPGLATNHIIHLQLKKTGQRLWLGVERAEFGKELNFRSPWKLFLENLANVSGIALARIEERQAAETTRIAEEAKRLREADDERMTIIANINATLMHQLITMVNNMRLSAVDFLENTSDSTLAPNEEALVFINNLKNKTEMMKELTRAYNKIIGGDGLGTCLIAEAARSAEKLFSFELGKQLIETEINIPADLAVKVPSNVVAMALANFIGNAIDAIQSRGKITIATCVKDGIVRCHVINDGPRISEVVIPTLFRPGAKGKDGHPGSGLYLVSRMLSDYRGEVELSYSRATETCFTFCLPKIG